MSDWRTVALADVLEIKHGFAFPGQHFSDVGPGPLVVTPGNFQIGGGWRHAKAKYYVGREVAGYTLSPGDVLVTMTDLSKAADTLGYSAVVPMGGPYLHNQRIGLVRPHDKTQVHARFVAYLLRSPDYRDYVIATATGSTVRHTSPSRILAYRARIPPLAEQRVIAEVLGALDDKIDANSRLVPLLREFAIAKLLQAADPTTSYVVGDVAEVRKGLSYTGAGLADEGMPMVNLANADNFGWLKRSGFKHYTGPYEPRHVAPPGSLLVSGVEQTWRHEIIGWPMLLPNGFGPALFSQDVFVTDFQPEQAWLRLPLWAHLYTSDARARLESMVYGTTVARFPTEALAGLEFPAPAKDALVLQTAEDLISRAWAAERESERLAALRDALLPPLMDGRLGVRDTAA